MQNNREHQVNAINNFEDYYYNNPNTRGILSMCCGSGKTFTFYGIMKNCITNHNENLFIYATSRILLVKGIVKDIIKWTFFDKLDVNILIKVSDFNISDIFIELKKDKILSNNKEFDNYFNDLKKNKFKKLDNEKDIIDTLKSRYILENKKIIIITTYESSKDIINSISQYNKEKDEKLKEIIPNLLTMDESHNLVSENNNIKTAKLLLEESEDKNFYPDKYLFMTATPLKVIKRNKSSTYNNDEIIYSMSNENIYGKVFFEYTFYEGINKYPQCVLNFDVIYFDDSEIQDDNINELLENLKFLNKDEQQFVYFDTIAQILLRIIKNYNLKHILIYLSNQTKVKYFYDILKKYILTEELYMIISDQSTTEKKNNQKKFEEDKNNPKILLSVDILNEGIDIPIVDSIFFAEERNSETTIVQNIGRALRLHENKKKAYVILPTKIYTIDNSYENTYSSKFKKIREICDILKESPDINIPKYYKRKTKGDSKSFKNDNEDEIINEKSGLVDNIVQVNLNENIITEDNNISITKKDELNIISMQLANTFEIKSSNDNLSNISLDKLKKIVQEENIKNLYELSKFLDDKCIITNKPHIYCKDNWICYSDLLFNKVYSYEEAINIIKLHDLTNIDTPKKWFDYYNNLIEIEMTNENNKILNDIFYIPYDPRHYYLEEWNNSCDEENNNELFGWNKFLGKELDNTTGFQINSKKSSVSINAENNLKNIVNKDKDKIKKLIGNSWQTFENYNTDISELKSYVDKFFGIDSIIEIRFMLNNLLCLKQKTINVHLHNLPLDIIPITIDFNKKIKYDKDIFDMSILLSKNKDDIKKDRFNDHNIHNKNVQITIDNILIELNNYINEKDK